MKLFKFAIVCFVFSAAITSTLAQSPTPPQVLKGILSAQPGTVITLANDNKEAITVTAANDGNSIYSQTSFSFGIRYPAGASYSVRISKAPAGQTCTIYAGATGTIRAETNDLRVGCDSMDLVSRSRDNKSFGTFNDSWTPVVGGEQDGRYVAYVSQAVGLDGSTGKFRQIVWRDRNTGETKLISRSPSGDEGNQNSLAPAISADGRSVAFESYANNLVSGDSNGARDVFLWRNDTGKVERVSTARGGAEANYQSYEPAISGDGGLVAFTSDATNIIPNILGISSTNVYLKDMRSGAIRIISIDEKTKKGGGGSNPSISEDGSRIAFYNYAPLTQDDKNGLWDIYVWDSGSTKLKRISLTSSGGERNKGAESTSRVVAPAISGNGRFVAFATTATNMAGADTNGIQDVFVANVDSGEVSLASVSAEGKAGDGDSPIGQGEQIAIDYSGNLVAFTTNSKNLGGKVILRNMKTGESLVVAPNPSYGVGKPSISRSGSYVVFGSADKLDTRFGSSGIFASYTGRGGCRFCQK